MQVDELRVLLQIGQHRRRIRRVDEHGVAGALDPRRQALHARRPGLDAAAMDLDHLRLDVLRDKLARHIEPQVVEVYGDGAESWVESFGRALSQRCEKSGETMFCYTRDADPMVHELERRRDVRYLHRHANLEDVFLKLTGRELRD